jgi:ATP-binding cassette subfamily B protein
LAQAPAIFILDEATANIDPFTESQIQEAMDLILDCTTSILIAHRLSTVRAVDRIIILEKGSVIEQGSHEALMARGSHYAELYDTDFRHQSPEYRAPTPVTALGILTKTVALSSGRTSVNGPSCSPHRRR